MIHIRMTNLSGKIKIFFFFVMEEKVHFQNGPEVVLLISIIIGRLCNPNYHINLLE